MKQFKCGKCGSLIKTGDSEKSCICTKCNTVQDVPEKAVVIDSGISSQSLKRFIIIALITVALGAGMWAGSEFYIRPELYYSSAEKLIDEGEYDDAYKYVEKLADHNYQSEKYKTLIDKEAEWMLYHGNYVRAEYLYTKLGATDGIDRTKYEKACHCLEWGEYDEAISFLSELGDRFNSSELIITAKYKKAQRLAGHGFFDESDKIIDEIKNCISSEEIQEYKSIKIEALINEGKFNEADALIAELEKADYLSEEIQEYKFKKAEELMARKQFDKAAADFAKLGDYSDSLQMKEIAEKAAVLKTQMQKIQKSKNMIVSIKGKKSEGLGDDGAIYYAVGNEGDNPDAEDDTEYTIIGSNKYYLSCDVASVDTGTEHDVYLLADGTVYESAGSVSGETGYLLEWDMSGWKYLEDVSATEDYIVGLRSDGTVLGAGTVFEWKPEDVRSWDDNYAFWENIVAISAENKYLAGITSSGDIMIYGKYNSDLDDVKGWHNIVGMATSDSSIIGIKEDGTVVAAGKINDKEADLSRWSNITMAALEDDYAVGLRSDGTVVYAGYDNNIKTAVSGWKNIVSITAGEGCVLGVNSDGKVVAAGSVKDGWDFSDWILKVD